MQISELLGDNALYYLPLIGGVIGLVLGLIPLIAGVVKKKIRLGCFGLVASTVGGALLGVFLSIPVTAVFTWLIFRNSDSGDTPEELS
jgi:cobalamin synthase